MTPDHEPEAGFGKHYASMYRGSMVGAGAVVFALMGYVIAEQKPCADGVFRLELNPKLLAFVIGESEERIREGLEFLCSADAESRTKSEEGRRLVKEGEFLYRVVNGAKYRAFGSAARRKEQNRVNQAALRNRRKKASGGSGAETAYVKAEKEGATKEQLDQIVTQSLPEGLQ